MTSIGEEFLANNNEPGVDVYQLAENFVHKEHNCFAAMLDFNKRAFGWDFHRPEPIQIPKDMNQVEDVNGWADIKKRIVKTEEW